jgi:Protein of unknown function (DUF3421)
MRSIILLFSVLAIAHLALNEETTERYCVKWVVSSNGGVPVGALVAGNNDDESLYICRVYHDYHLVIGEGIEQFVYALL